MHYHIYFIYICNAINPVDGKYSIDKRYIQVFLKKVIRGDYYMKEGSPIKQIRKSLKLSQTVFSSHLGLNQGSYSSIESGKTNISQQVKRALLREFNVNPKYLDKGKGEMFLTDEKELHRRIDELLKLYGLSMEEFIAREFGRESDLVRQIQELKNHNKMLEDRVESFAKQILMYERLLAEKEEKFNLLKDQLGHPKDPPL